MKLKPQPRPKKVATRPSRAAARRAVGARPKGRQARRPGVPLRARIGGRIPSLRRVAAVAGAAAAAGALIGLLNGPWLRVSAIASTGEQYADAARIEEVLAAHRGESVLAVDTRALRQRLEAMPAVASAEVSATLTGRIEASVLEREPAFVWETRSAVFLGAADGTIFAGSRHDDALGDGLEALPHVRDDRFVARVISIGDVIPDEVLRTALRVSAIDPASLGSAADRVSVRLDDEYGFRIVSAEPAWEVALGVYGVDPRETAAEADARLERQITAVRTLFASRDEAQIGWVDVRNPGKVYFRAKG